MKIIVMLFMLLTLATQQLEKPYIYATAGPNSYDCTGLVCYCYKEVFNIDLPRSAYDMGYCEDYEKITTIANLKQGDVVFFNTNKHDGDLSDHAGIYLGSNKFVHASSGKGKVLISPIDEGFYNERFSWGRRIIYY